MRFLLRYGEVAGFYDREIAFKINNRHGAPMEPICN
jgi:hypothetical protein